MSEYEVLFWTPENSHSTAHSTTRRVIAESLAEAERKILEQVVEAGQIVLTGRDKVDSFGGLDRDHYEIGEKSKRKFRSELKELIREIRRL